MLWRALRGVEKGFYIDVGACSPDHDSVTRAFYERGWRGINIEPNPAWRSALEERRPEDINLFLVLGAQPGTAELAVFGDAEPAKGIRGYEVGDTGITTIDPETAKYQTKRGYEFRAQLCAVMTLNAIWEKYIVNSDVHFLKVDVEGSEIEVLRGNDWRRHRPWIVVAEATHASSQEPAFAAWESLLLHPGGELLQVVFLRMPESDWQLTLPPKAWLFYQPSAANVGADGAYYGDPAVNQAGFMAYGPYVSLPPGRYEVTFWLSAGQSGAQAKVAKLDVSVNDDPRAFVGANRMVSGADFTAARADQAFTLEFTDGDPRNLVEFRVYTNDVVPLRLSRVQLRRIGVYQP